MKYEILITLTNIKLASKHNLGYIMVPKTKNVRFFLESMQKQGMISSFCVSYDRLNYKVYLSLYSSVNEILKKIRLISTKSRPFYLSFLEISKRYKVKDFLVLSTSKGILLSEDIFLFKIGGFVLSDAFSFK